MSKEEFKISLNINRDPKELDYLGFTTDKSIYKFILAARSNYWDIVGEIPSYIHTNIAPVVVSHNFEILKRIKIDDEIVIYTRVSEIKTSSIRFLYEVYDNNNQLCVTASDVFVAFDFNLNQRVPLNAEVKHRIEEVESGIV